MKALTQYKPIDVEFREDTDALLRNGNKVDLNYQKFIDTILDQTKDYPEPIPVVSIKQNDELIPVFTEKAISLIQGKQKSKKTTFLAMAIAAYIAPKRNDTDTILVSGSEGVVLFFDTEQGESYAANTMKRILKMAGTKLSDKLIYSNLREYMPTQRLELIKAAVENIPNVKLVIIDGIVDLMDDFMESKEAHSLVTELLKLSSIHNIHIAGVLHQNKGDNNARAHIGTIMSQKAEIEISTTVDKNNKTLSQVECVSSRGRSFEKFNIKWEKGELPIIESNLKNENVSKTTETEIPALSKLKKIAEAFEIGKYYQSNEAKEAIMKATAKSEKTAYNRLNELVLHGLIEKTGENQKIRYFRNQISNTKLICLNP